MTDIERKTQKASQKTSQKKYFIFKWSFIRMQMKTREWQHVFFRIIKCQPVKIRLLIILMFMYEAGLLRWYKTKGQPYYVLCGTLLNQQ